MVRNNPNEADPDSAIIDAICGEVSDGESRNRDARALNRRRAAAHRIEREAPRILIEAGRRIRPRNIAWRWRVFTYRRAMLKAPNERLLEAKAS